MVSPVSLHLDYRTRKHTMHPFPELCNFNNHLAHTPLQHRAHLYFLCSQAKLNIKLVFTKQADIFGWQVPCWIYLGMWLCLFWRQQSPPPPELYKFYQNFSLSLCLSSDMQRQHNVVELTYNNVLQYVTNFHFFFFMLTL